MPAVQSYKTPGTHWSSLSIVHILAVCNWNVVSQPLFHYKCKGEREVKKELFRSPSLRRERWGARRGSVDAFLFTGALRFFALYFVWLGACCVWHAKCNACFAAGMLQNTYLTTYIYYKIKKQPPVHGPTQRFIVRRTMRIDVFAPRSSWTTVLCSPPSPDRTFSSPTPPLLAISIPSLLFFRIVVQHDLRTEESLMQLFDALEYLDDVVDDVFGKIEAKVRVVDTAVHPSFPYSFSHAHSLFPLFRQKL